MNAEEFLENLLNSCIKIKDKSYPNKILWITSASIRRQKKLCRILNSEIKFNNKEKYFVLFYQELNRKTFHFNSNSSYDLFFDYYIFPTEIDSFCQNIINKRLKNYIVKTINLHRTFQVSNNIQIIK